MDLDLMDQCREDQNMKDQDLKKKKVKKVKILKLLKKKKEQDLPKDNLDLWHRMALLVRMDF